MSQTGESFDPALTRAINALARADSMNVRFSTHALQRMTERGIDQMDVMTCLRRGRAYAPEWHNSDLRSRVVHRGAKTCVVVGGLADAVDNWQSLQSVVAVTVMDIE